MTDEVSQFTTGPPVYFLPVCVKFPDGRLAWPGDYIRVPAEEAVAKVRVVKRNTMQCTNCGCEKPCACDGFTPEEQDTCVKCGCTKPCACDGYTERDDEH